MIKNAFNNVKLLVLVALSMGFALGASGAHGGDEFEYREPVYIGGIVTNGVDHWETKSIIYDYDEPGTCHIVANSSSAVTWGAAGVTNWYVVTNGTFQITGGVTCKGDVRLILCDGAQLTVDASATAKEAGINVYNDDPKNPVNLFTVYGQTDGTGKLIAKGGGGTGAQKRDHGMGGAGIGGKNIQSGSCMTFCGGQIEAFAGGGAANGSLYYDGAAGIGGGYSGVGSQIVICGGSVSATGKYTGSGIGGGGNSTGEDIIILGGIVKAYGSRDSDTSTFAASAGIGGGAYGSAKHILILNGTVSAVGGNDSTIGAPGIGAGQDANEESSDIKVSASLIVKASTTTPPEDVVAHSANQDIASNLAGKIYVEIEQAPFVAAVEVEKGGVISTNAGLAEAFAAIGENGTGTVTMLADVTMTGTGAAWVPNGSDITLDLAGKKIDWTTSKGDSPLYFAAGTNGKLTIKDSGEGGTISTYCDSSEVTNSALIVYSAGNGDLTVDGGTFVCSNKVGAATLFFKNGTGDWTFNGGSYKALGEGAGGAHFLYCGGATGTTVVAGGTYDIRATASAAAGVASNAECSDKIMITNGDFDVITAGAWSGAFSCGNGSMVVKGGDFSVKSSVAGVYCFLAERSGTTILSNGTFYAETTDGYAYAAGANQTATLTIAGGKYSCKAFNETAATVVGKEQAMVTIVESPVINNGATDGTAWNLAVQLFGAKLDFSGYTGANLQSVAVFADGTYGVSYVTGDMTRFNSGTIFDGYFSTYPNDGWVQNGRRAFANTNEPTKVAYPWVINDAVTYTPTSVDNTTVVVYTNGAAMAAAASYTLETNAANVKVVYTTEGDYFFEGGLKVITNQLNTAKNPATIIGDLPVVLEPVEYREPVYKGTDGNPTNGIAYWTTNTCYNYTTVGNSLGPLGDPWGENGKTTWLVVSESGIEIAPYAKCFGDVKLILCDGASLTVKGGIGRDPNATLTIYAELEGTGELIAVNGVSDSGIGSENITINGGRITAIGSGGGAGIGGDRQCVASNIVINAGVVTAIGGGDNSTGGGAGIGGGAYRAGCDITINGGTVVATGAVSAAGIGGAAESSGTRIVINGGTVRATGGSFGAGIGGGGSGLGSQIAISGGAVQATGGCSAAGIGGGANAVGTDILISGGVVKAVGGDTAAGIGAGYCMNGSGSRITISSGRVTAIGGYLGAGIGGGHRCAYSKIAIGGDAKVLVGSARYRDDGLVSAAELIGNGYEVDDPAEEVTIAATAQVFFNLTGCYDKTTEAWTEEIAPMPEAFDGFAILTPAIQTEDRVLVGGVATSQPLNISKFALTNAVTAATGSIKVDGAETTFAGTYCTLTNREGQLTFTIRKPVLTVTQLPDLTNGYTIVASTDGNNGITNYAWCTESEATTDFVALTNLLDEILAGAITGIEVVSSDFDGNGELILLSWPGEDLPADGELRFSCDTELADASDVVFGEAGVLGTLTQIGTEYVWRFNSYAGCDYLCICAKAGTSTSFTIKDLRLVSASYKPVAQGPTMTALPADVGMKGSNYVCRMDYGHEGFFYTGKSDEFVFWGYPITAQPTAVAHTTCEVYTNGVLSSEIEPGKWAAWSNESATVVYTADPGYAFVDGTLAKTNEVDTSKNPATVKGDPVVPVAIPAGIVIAGEGTLPDPYKEMPRYPSFTDAYTNAIVAWVTNVHVFGMQNIMTNPVQNTAWNLELVDGASISIGTVDKGEGFPYELVNITNTLASIVGEGTIVLSVTNGTPGAAAYKEALETLIGGAEVKVVYANITPELKEETNPESGKVLPCAEVKVDQQALAEAVGQYVVSGFEIAGKITVEIMPDVTTDVLVAGKLVSREWDVVIVNATTNTLTVGAIETGMNVLITNVTKVGKIVTLENVIAGKNIKIDNNGHLEADVNATDNLYIHNTSANTLVGTYKAGGTINISGEYGSLSNALVDAATTLTITGTNVISGPVDLKVGPGYAIDFKDKTRTDWSVAGDNHTAMIDFTDVTNSAAFGILIDGEQATNATCGVYTIASNATAAASREFPVIGPDGATLATLTPGDHLLYVGSKSFALSVNAANELVFTIGFGKFAITYDAVEGAWESGACVSNLDAYVNTGYALPETPVRDGYVFDGWHDGWTNEAPVVTNAQPLVRLAPHTIYARWKPDAANPASRSALGDFKADGTPRLEIAQSEFQNNRTLVTVDVPAFCTKIGRFAFRSAVNLATVNFVRPHTYADYAETTLEIDEAAFMNATSLTEVSIPACVTKVGKYAFSGCTKLKDVYFLGDLDATAFGEKPFISTGRDVGGVMIHLSPAAAANAALVAAITNGSNTAFIKMDPTMAGEIPVGKIQSFAVTPFIITVEIKADSLPAGTPVNLRTVSAISATTLDKLAAGEYLAPTEVVLDGDTYRFTFPTPTPEPTLTGSGASRFFRMAILPQNDR